MACFSWVALVDKSIVVIVLCDVVCRMAAEAAIAQCTDQTTPMMARESSTFAYAAADELLALHNWYQRYHGYLASIVCIFGIVANTINIIVLTRPNMVSSINCILTGLAISDGLTMAAYLPFALRFYVLYGLDWNPERNSYAAINYMLFFACFSVVVHSISIWLTVALAIFRYATKALSLESNSCDADYCDRMILLRGVCHPVCLSLRRATVRHITAAKCCYDPRRWLGSNQVYF